MHPAANPYQALSVSTSSPAQLVTMLYDRALVAIDRARHAAAAAGDPSAAATMNFELQRAQDIVMELRFALDHERGGGIAANLQSLYGFCLDLLIRANVSKDVSELAPVARTLRDLRDAWDEACCALPAGVA